MELKVKSLFETTSNVLPFNFQILDSHLLHCEVESLKPSSSESPLDRKFANRSLHSKNE